MKTNPVFLDFEFSRVTHQNVNLVSCVTLKEGESPKRWWLHNNQKEKKNLCEYLEKNKYIIGYSTVAEARSFFSLGLNPLDWEWVDLFVEYRMMTNHNHKLSCGNQLVDGKVKFIPKPKPKWERTEEDKNTGFSQTHSLVEATYKLLGEIRDSEEKVEMRNLIISDPRLFSDDQKERILAYNEEDVILLPRIWERLKEEFVLLTKNQVDLKEYEKEARFRGRYSAHTARMENYGYPIDYEKVKNFSNHVSSIIDDCQREINSLFPEIKPFRWNKKDQRFSWDQKATKDWVANNHDVSRWMKTDKGGISLSLEAFEQKYHFRHDYPKDNFGAQMLRYLKLKQSVYGFVPSAGKDKKSFWDYVGPDQIVRPYMNSFKAQSSRSQPSSTGFMFLKPAWMRAHVIPPKGKFMASLDYSGQEFFVSALKSRDQAMIEAYLSGDPYLAFAILSGTVPKNATKDKYPFERDLAKSTVLGLSYLMSKYGLAGKLTQDTGRIWTEDEAQEQIELFYEAFSDLQAYQENVLEEYLETGILRLEDGWYMWGDNQNHRSVANVPIQGFSAAVMRKAVDLAYEKSQIYIPFTLHDELFMIGDVGKEEQLIDLKQAMIEAFSFYLPEDLKKTAEKIRIGPFIWGPDYPENSEINLNGWKVPCSNLYVDERSIKDYEKFSPYFKKRSEDEI